MDAPLSVTSSPSSSTPSIEDLAEKLRKLESENRHLQEEVERLKFGLKDTVRSLS